MYIKVTGNIDARRSPHGSGYTTTIGSMKSLDIHKPNSPTSRHARKETL
jgi:hypothetical protein